MADFWIGLFVGLVVGLGGCGFYQQRLRNKREQDAQASLPNMQASTYSQPGAVPEPVDPKSHQNDYKRALSTSHADSHGKEHRIDMGSHHSGNMSPTASRSREASRSRDPSRSDRNHRNFNQNRHNNNNNYSSHHNKQPRKGKMDSKPSQSRNNHRHNSRRDKYDRNDRNDRNHRYGRNDGRMHESHQKRVRSNSPSVSSNGKSDVEHDFDVVHNIRPSIDAKSSFLSDGSIPSVPSNKNDDNGSSKNPRSEGHALSPRFMNQKNHNEHQHQQHRKQRTPKARDHGDNVRAHMWPVKANDRLPLPHNRKRDSNQNSVHSGGSHSRNSSKHSVIVHGNSHNSHNSHNSNNAPNPRSDHTKKQAPGNQKPSDKDRKNNNHNRTKSFAPDAAYGRERGNLKLVWASSKYGTQAGTNIATISGHNRPGGLSGLGSSSGHGNNLGLNIHHTSARSGDRRNLDGIAAAATNSLVLREQQEMLQMEIKLLERAKKEFEIHKKQTIQEYKLRKYEVDEQMKSYSTKKKLYESAHKKLRYNNPQYASLIAKQLEMNKQTENSKDSQRRLTKIQSLYQNTYSLLDTVRQEISRLMILKSEHNSKIKTMKRLIGKKSDQHKEFIDTIKKLKHETFYLPWIVNGKEYKASIEVEEIRQHIAQDWDVLEKEKYDWYPMKRKIEIKNALLTEIDNEKAMLKKIQKETSDARKNFNDLKRSLLNDIAKQDANSPHHSQSSKIDDRLLRLKHNELKLECRNELLEDDLRNLEFEKMLLLMQEKHLNDEKLSYERKQSIVDAKLRHLESSRTTQSQNNVNSDRKDNDNKFDANKQAESQSKSSPSSSIVPGAEVPVVGAGGVTPGGMVSRAELNRSEREKKSQENTISSLKQLLATKDQQISSINQTLRDKTRDYNLKQTEVETSKQKIVELQIQLAEARKNKEEKQAIKDVIEKFQADIKTYHKKNVELEIELNEYKDKYEKANKLSKDYESIKREKLELENEIVDYKSQIVKLETEVEELQNYCAYLEEHNSAIEAQFNDILNANAQAMEETQAIRQQSRKRKAKSLHIPGRTAIEPDTDDNESKTQESSIFDRDEFLRKFKNGTYDDVNSEQMMADVTNFAKKVSMDVGPNDRFLRELASMSDDVDDNNDDRDDVQLNLDYFISNESQTVGGMDEIERELRNFEARFAKQFGTTPRASDANKHVSNINQKEISVSSNTNTQTNTQTNTNNMNGHKQNGRFNKNQHSLKFKVDMVRANDGRYDDPDSPIAEDSAHSYMSRMTYNTYHTDHDGNITDKELDTDVERTYSNFQE